MLNRLRCEEGWSGDDCSCDESESRCYSPFNEEVCSNHGVSGSQPKLKILSIYRRSFQTCECNRCRCDTAEDGRVFSGKAAFGP